MLNLSIGLIYGSEEFGFKDLFNDSVINYLEPPFFFLTMMLWNLSLILEKRKTKMKI